MKCKLASKHKAGVPQMRMTDPPLSVTQPENGLVTLHGDPGHTICPIYVAVYATVAFATNESNIRNGGEQIRTRRYLLLTTSKNKTLY